MLSRFVPSIGFVVGVLFVCMTNALAQKADIFQATLGEANPKSPEISTAELHNPSR
jgi:hypothetical protein